jgi:dTDP-4-dehydrorhamnose reductase
MIWLIGKSGLLGQEVELMLKEKNFSYVASGHETDITDFDNLKDFSKDKQINWIINCAAYTAVDKAEEDSENAFKLNHHAVCNIIKIATEKNAKIIHISTDYVFDGNKNSKYTEDDIPNPLNIYGKSKFNAELELKEYEKSFIIRISWLFGHNKNNFVKTMLSLFNSKEEIKVINDQFGLPTYTRDLSKLLGEIISIDSAAYGIYHFCNSGEEISWFDFTSEIYRQAKDFQLLDKEVKITPITTKEYKQLAERPKKSAMSTEKIRQVFGCTPPSWQDALNHFLKKEFI